MEHAIGNIFVRQMTGEGVDPGWVMKGHEHSFDHVSEFFNGRWKVRRWRKAVDADGGQLALESGEPAWVQFEDFEREAPFYLLIEAGCRHEFTYLGHAVPPWMESYLAQLPDGDGDRFRAEYDKTQGKAWCVYSHRTAQGDVVEHATGWEGAYR